MKKPAFIFFTLIALFSFPFSGKANCLTESNSSFTVYTDIIKVEYFMIGDQLFKITYYGDGTFQIVAVATTES